MLTCRPAAAAGGATNAACTDALGSPSLLCATTRTRTERAGHGALWGGARLQLLLVHAEDVLPARPEHARLRPGRAASAAANTGTRTGVQTGAGAAAAAAPQVVGHVVERQVRRRSSRRRRRRRRRRARRPAAGRARRRAGRRRQRGAQPALKAGVARGRAQRGHHGRLLVRRARAGHPGQHGLEHLGAGAPDDHADQVLLLRLGEVLREQRPELLLLRAHVLLQAGARGGGQARERGGRAARVGERRRAGHAPQDRGHFFEQLRLLLVVQRVRVAHVPQRLLGLQRGEHDGVLGLRVRAVDAPQEAVAALQRLQRSAAAAPVLGFVQRGRERARLGLQAAQVAPQRLVELKDVVDGVDARRRRRRGRAAAALARRRRASGRGRGNPAAGGPLRAGAGGLAGRGRGGRGGRGARGCHARGRRPRALGGGLGRRGLRARRRP